MLKMEPTTAVHCFFLLRFFFAFEMASICISLAHKSISSVDEIESAVCFIDFDRSKDRLKMLNTWCVTATFCSTKSHANVKRLEITARSQKCKKINQCKFFAYIKSSTSTEPSNSMVISSKFINQSKNIF